MLIAPPVASPTTAQIFGGADIQAYNNVVICLQLRPPYSFIFHCFRKRARYNPVVTLYFQDLQGRIRRLTVKISEQPVNACIFLGEPPEADSCRLHYAIGMQGDSQVSVYINSFKLRQRQRSLIFLSDGENTQERYKRLPGRFAAQGKIRIIETGYEGKSRKIRFVVFLNDRPPRGS